MKICILYGGTSSERAVSLNTGKSIYDAICNDYEVSMHDWDGDYESMYNVARNVDLVFVALHGGDGEDGTVQKYLESKRIKFTGSSSLASKKAIDKNLSKLLCVKHNIPTPIWFMIEGVKKGNENNLVDSIKKAYKEDIKKFYNYNVYDCVIKPNDEGSSIGVKIIKNFYENLHLLEELCSSTMIEKYIDGRELTVSILDNEVLPIVEIIPSGEYYDYKCKYTKFQSEYVVPAEIDKNTQELLSAYSLKIHKLIGCGSYSRIDFRLSEDNEVCFLELNTLPGFTDTSLFPKSAKAAGLEYKDLIKKIIEIT